MVTAMEVIPTISNPITIIIRMVTVATAVTAVTVATGKNNKILSHKDMKIKILIVDYNMVS